MTDFAVRVDDMDPILVSFLRQFPDLQDNHVAWMCFREGYEAGYAMAKTEDMEAEPIPFAGWVA